MSIIRHKVTIIGILLLAVVMALSVFVTVSYSSEEKCGINMIDIEGNVTQESFNLEGDQLCGEVKNKCKQIEKTENINCNWKKALNQCDCYVR